MPPLSNTQPVVRPRNNARLLLAEDNDVNLHIATAMLRSLNVDVETVHNGEEAVVALLQGSFDLVLMDCQMPVMDGFAATRAIRRQHPNIHLPIIALTANNADGDHEHCLAAGMDDYLSKPFNREQLQAMVIKWLGPAV